MHRGDPEGETRMEKWLKWAIEIQSLAQTGLAYTKDVYDRERYERLREISAEMLAEKSGMGIEKVKNLLFSRMVNGIVRT